jgi:hypothetical protein
MGSNFDEAKRIYTDFTTLSFFEKQAPTRLLIRKARFTSKSPAR